MKHKHLSLEERYYIEIALKEGNSCNAIAKALHRAQSTISQEIKRNTGQRGYRHKQANRMAIDRRKHKPKAIKLTHQIKAFIRDEMQSHQSSPEQIAGRLKQVKGIALH